MIGYFARQIFGTRNDRILKSLKPVVMATNDLESKFKQLSDSELARQTILFRERVEKGESLDSLRPEAFAAVREASVRTLGMRHFDVQLIGGCVLNSGKIAEMKTGEGKTLVATLAAYLNALSGKGVHVVTVNDYLAKRDAEWMGQLYGFLGMSTGVVHHGQSEKVKREAYKADITYGQNNEFGFDYLRDNMKFSMREQLQRGHHFAIVDEVDSILIDEARTPLIISGPAEEATDQYYSIDKIIPGLEAEKHYQIDLKTKQPTLTEDGITRAEQLLGINNLYDPQNIETLHHVNQALRAHKTMERDVDYVVKDGQVIIVDEFTGRLMPGRRWSNGLHQAVEAKESVAVARENQTLASITFQNLFRMYDKLSGMTGTADTEAGEFMHIYKLEVVVIPTNRPNVRKDETDKVFRTRKEKYNAVVEDIAELNKTGRPILVGTVSIEQSEALASILKQRGVPHNVLNAKQHEREAEIVAQAGRFGAVTISTNMAGRGTDIILGGNPHFLAASASGTKDRSNPKYIAELEKFTLLCAEEKEKVIAAGGLMILGTERHESRRIDNQLRGRSGRQGDPGGSCFYISLEDDLMKRFGGDRLQNVMKRLGWEEGMAIDGRLISRSIESAQKKVEGFHFESRKHVTEYDDVMNKQRKVIYNLRAKVLSGTAIRDEIFSMIDDLFEEAVLAACPERTKPIEWDLKALADRFQFLTGQSWAYEADAELDAQKVFDSVRNAARARYDQTIGDLQSKLSELKAILERESQAPGAVVRPPDPEENLFDVQKIERDMMLETLDHYWNLHLQEMDYLREGIGLRGYGQKNPLLEYQREGFLMFQQMMSQTQETVLRKLFYFEVQDREDLIAQIEAEKQRRLAQEKKMQLIHQSAIEPQAEGSAAVDVRNPDEQRARIEAQKKARRKAKSR